MRTHLFSADLPDLRGAGFQTCRAADFQAGSPASRAAGLETRGTAALEVCATPNSYARTVAHTLPAGAFSLVEMLVVLALLIILTVMSASRFTTSDRRREMAACQGNLEKIYLALSLYRGDNSAWPALPEARASEVPLSLLVPKCTTDTGIFLCPSSGDKALPEGERFARGRISYAYYMGRTASDDPQDIVLSDWQVDSAPKKKGQPVFSLDGQKPGNNHRANGGNLLSCGGAASSSGARAERDLLFPSTVRLLNP